MCEENDHSEIEDQEFKRKSRPYSSSWYYIYSL